MLYTTDSCSKFYHLCYYHIIYYVTQQPPKAPRPQSAGYLRSHSSTGWAYTTDVQSRPASVLDIDLRETNIERQPQRAQTAREPSNTRKNVDFVKMNSHGVKNVPLRRSPSISTLDEQKQRKEIEMTSYKRGEVPD